MAREQQKSRRLTRRKGTLGATGLPGTPQGYHIQSFPGKQAVECRCGACSNRRLAEASS